VIEQETWSVSRVSNWLLTAAILWLGCLSLVSVPSHAASGNADIPGWLHRHIGLSDGQIAPVVLQRARALHQRKVREGAVSNACYFAFDATRPNAIGGKPGRRFYTICEGQRFFRAVSSGHGNGRKLQRANFSNGRQCARHFSNAEGSHLSAGGAYVTAETRTSFKGYFTRAGETRPLNRTFLLFDGEGETANAREREIGGHQAVFLRRQCRFKYPASPHADASGYVPFGALVNYTGGRSNGCTTWSQSATQEIIGLVEGNPAALYIYPESRDITAVATAVARGTSLSAAGAYWDATCLQAIRSPKFWPKERLQPIINQWRQSLPAYTPRDLPICQ
jgi:hypothetical protein